MVIVRRVPPLYEYQVRIELPGSWNIVMSPRRQGAVWRRPRRPRAADMIRTLYVLSAALWKVLQVLQLGLEIRTYSGP